MNQTGVGAEGRWDARAIIGLDLDDARREAERHGCQLRLVGGRDVDPDVMLTMDARSDRINVDVSDGIVTGLNGLGNEAFVS